MAEYTYKLSNGKTLYMNGDTEPSPQDVFSFAQENNVQLDTAEMKKQLDKQREILVKQNAAYEAKTPEMQKMGVVRTLAAKAANATPGLDEFARSLPGKAVIALGEVGPYQLAHGAKQLGRAVRSGDINEAAEGASKSLRGGLTTLAPLVLPGAVAAAPLATAAGIGGGLIAQPIAERAAEGFGASPEVAGLAGDVAGLGAGVAAAKIPAAAARAVGRFALPKVPAGIENAAIRFALNRVPGVRSITDLADVFEAAKSRPVGGETSPPATPELPTPEPVLRPDVGPPPPTPGLTDARGIPLGGTAGPEMPLTKAPVATPEQIAVERLAYKQRVKGQPGPPPRPPSAAQAAPETTPADLGISEPPPPDVAAVETPGTPEMPFREALKQSAVKKPVKAKTAAQSDIQQATSEIKRQSTGSLLKMATDMSAPAELRTIVLAELSSRGIKP